MFSLTAEANTAGIAVLSAAARTAVASLGVAGEGAGLVMTLLATDATARLSGGEESTELVIKVINEGSELMLSLHDRGLPIVGPPDSVLPLLDHGVMTSISASASGDGNVTQVRFPLPSYHKILDLDGIEHPDTEVELTAEPVTLRILVPEDAVELTRTIYRCYGWSYPNGDFYYPDRVAAMISSGERIGEVAVTQDGRIAAHWGALFLSPSVVETGVTVTDPAFRKRGLAQQVGDRLLERLIAAGIAGRLREPVLTHSATQHIALTEGATMVGAYLHYSQPLMQVGITQGMLTERTSLSVAYTALKPLTSASISIPAPYLPFVQSILEFSQWPRTFADLERMAVISKESQLATRFDASNRMGIVEVTVAGEDLVEAVDSAMEQMRRSGAEYVQVRLPANQPALALVGAGLTELGLGFGTYIPEFRPASQAHAGDILVTQWLADPAVDTGAWVYANDGVEQLMKGVVDQAKEVGGRGMVQRRRAARRAQLFAALD